MGDNVGGGLYMTTHNLHENDINLDNNLIQLDILMKDKIALTKAEILRGHDLEQEELKNTNNVNIQLIKGRLPELVEILNREMRCSYRKLYEIIMLEIKNRLLSIQKQRKICKNLKRDEFVRREDYMKRTFGENSQQQHDVREEILRLNDMMFRERANKFKEF
jgi:hypothetical protein